MVKNRRSRTTGLKKDARRTAVWSSSRSDPTLEERADVPGILLQLSALFEAGAPVEVAQPRIVRVAIEPHGAEPTFERSRIAPRQNLSADVAPTRRAAHDHAREIERRSFPAGPPLRRLGRRDEECIDGPVAHDLVYLAFLELRPQLAHVAVVRGWYPLSEIARADERLRFLRHRNVGGQVVGIRNRHAEHGSSAPLRISD